MQFWEGHDGLKLAGDVWGDPSGPLVLLQHGGGQTRHAWKGAGEALGAAGYHAIAFDARGHGDSDWAPDGKYGQDAMVLDLEALVAALGGRRPVLVGASMGGGTSLVAVGEGHVDATALVLVDIAPRIEPDGVARIQAFMAQRPDGFESLEEVAQAIASYQPHRKPPKNLDGLAKNVRLGEDGRYRWHWDPRFRTGQRDLAQRQARLEACARSLTLPTLLVRGGLSDILSEEGAAAFMELCPNAEYVNVEGAAHMVAGDRNDIFAGAVIDFLRRTVSVESSSAPGAAAASPPPRSSGRRARRAVGGDWPWPRELRYLPWVAVKYFTVGSVATFVHHRGPTTLPGRPPAPGAGASVLCVHDVAGNGNVFAGVLDALADGHRPDRLRPAGPRPLGRARQPRRDRRHGRPRARRSPTALELDAHPCCSATAWAPPSPSRRPPRGRTGRPRSSCAAARRPRRRRTRPRSTSCASSPPGGPAGSSTPPATRPTRPARSTSGRSASG